MNTFIKDVNRSPVGGYEPERDPEGGRLPGPVVPDEAEAVALFDGQIQVVERGQLTVLLGEVDRLDRPQTRQSPLRPQVRLGGTQYPHART